MQIRIAADDDTVLQRLDLHDVLRIAGSEQSLALSDGVLMNSAMGAENFAVKVDDVARGLRREGTVLFNKLGVGTSLDKADFLRLGLVIRGQSGASCNLTNFCFGQLAKGEDGLR